MIAKFKVQIYYYRSIGRKLREINNALRDTLREDTAVWWILERAPKHFETGAVSAYQYVARTAAYLKRRAGMARKRGESSRPLVFSGELEKEVKGGGVAGWNRRAWATSANQRLRISRRLPHKMQRMPAAEITALNAADHRQMCVVTMRGFGRRMEERSAGSESRTIAAA